MKFDRVILILSLIVGSIAAYYAYKSYKIAASPEVVVRLLTLKGGEERVSDTIKVNPKSVVRNRKLRKGYFLYELPLLLVNKGETDAKGMTIRIGPPKGENWRLARYKDEEVWVVGKKGWFVAGHDYLPPSIQVDLKRLVIIVKDRVKEVNLSW